MHTQFRASLIGLLLSLAATPCFADTTDIRASDRAVMVGVGGLSQKYGESDGVPTPDTETGWMPSLDANVTWLTPSGDSAFSDMYLNLDLQGSFGQTNYVGHLQPGNKPFDTHTDNEIVDVSAKVGHFFSLADGVALSPYLDLGYRSWRRNVSGGGTVENSIENYQNGEGLAGLLLQVSPMSGLVMSASGGFGETLGPQMLTSGTTFKLGSESMWQVEGKVGYALNPKFELIGDARLVGFGFGASNMIDGAYEPDSYTHQLSILGGLAYHL